jgi:hypothetical protein
MYKVNTQNNTKMSGSTFRPHRRAKKKARLGEVSRNRPPAWLQGAEAAEADGRMGSSQPSVTIKWWWNSMYHLVI